MALICFIGCLIRYRGSREAITLLFFPCVLAVVMVVLKTIIAQKRPEGSCLTSCGMPSGHSMSSIGLLTFLVCELVTRSSMDGVPREQLLVVLAIIFLPVPWSRVQLHDHSVAQVIAGSMVGLIL